MNNTTPQIRFKGFTDAWTQRKLGEVAEFKNGMNFDKEAMGHGHPFVNLQNIFGRTVVDTSSLGLAESSEQQRKEYGLLKGDVLFIRSSVKPEGVGEAAIISHDLIDTTYSGFTIRCRMAGDFDDGFKQFVFSIKPFRNQMLNSATTSANTNINQDSLNKMIIYAPSKPEQTSIGSFFRTLDDIIAASQRQITLLKQLKSAYLQQMFPQAGERVPRIRFEGFTEDWEVKKLSDICETTFGGGTPSTAKEEFWNGDIPWIQSSDLTEHNVTNVNLRKQITEQGLANSAAKLIPTNSIAVVTRVGVGKVCLVPFSYATSQDFLSLSNLKIDAWFGVYALYKKLQSELNSVQGTSIKGITKDELLSKTLTIPLSIHEQTAIGGFFRNLDTQITTQSEKTEKLKQLKSAYLQKMFI